MGTSRSAARAATNPPLPSKQALLKVTKAAGIAANHKVLPSLTASGKACALGGRKTSLRLCLVTVFQRHVEPARPKPATMKVLR